MQHEHEKMIPIYIDEEIHCDLKVFASKSGKNMHILLSPFIEEFKGSVKILVDELKSQSSTKTEP